MNLTVLIKRLFVGILIGIANIIPGVSGGTIALISGIYDRLIFSINQITDIFDLKQLDLENFKDWGRNIDYVFLVPVAVGLILAVILVTSGLSAMMKNYPGETYASFFGLIAGSTLIIYKYVEKLNLMIVGGIVFGVLVVAGFFSLDMVFSLQHPVFIFLGGVLSFVFMVLPGPSGSYVLIILGQYEFMLDAVNSFDLSVLAVYGAGAVVGTLGFVRILAKLLRKFRSITIAFLFGMMLGTLVELGSNAVVETSSYVGLVVPAMTFGLIVVLVEYYVLDLGEHERTVLEGH